MPRELGDEHDVVAAAHEVRHARVAQHVRRQLQAGAARGVADHEIDRARGQPASLRSDEQRRVTDVDALGALLQPRLERVADGLVQRHLAIEVALTRANRGLAQQPPVSPATPAYRSPA
jgi:hypothetical protein